MNEGKQISAHENILHQVILDLYWMARRYADGRDAFALSTYNEAINHAIGAGVKFDKYKQEPLYAVEADKRKSKRAGSATDKRLDPRDAPPV